MPVKNAANEDISVIIAEPKPEALPARCGIAFTISAFDAGQIIPDPKVIISMGRKKLKGWRKKFVSNKEEHGPKTSIKLPNTIKFFVDTKFAILLTNILPSTYPRAGNARYIPITVGDRLKTFTAIYGPPIKKIPKMEKLRANVDVGNQKFKLVIKMGYVLT